MKTKSTSLLLLGLLVFCLSGWESISKDVTQNNKDEKTRKVVQGIKKLYTYYGTNVAEALDPNAANDSILQVHFTDGLLYKIGRMKLATQSDPVIRAQDFSKSLIATLQVRHLKDNWYMVSYFDNEQIQIPLMASYKNENVIIDYITPEWNDSLYGDSLFFEEPIPVTIDDSTPLSLLKTFYDAYTVEYCSMPSDLTSQLETLRKRYLTTNALTQFKSAIDINDMNYLSGYDLLIDYYDFDRLWIPSIKFIYLGNNTYQMQYTKWKNNRTTITLSVIKQDDKYKINNIKIEK
mgnify:FL=1